MAVLNNVPGIEGPLQQVTLVNPTTGGAIGTPASPLQTATSSLQTTPDLTSVVLAITTATTTVASTATASQRTRVYRMRLNVAGAQKLTIQSATTTLEVLNFPAAATLIYDFATRPWWTTAVNQALNIVSTTTAETNIVLEITKNATA